jgi:molecular chaperone GrpE
MSPSDEESQGPVIRDRRRIDPLTGQVRDIPGQPGKHSAAPQPGHPAPPPSGRAGGGAAPGGGASAPPAGDADPGIALALAERTADLQRLQAEYANYRKRVERDRVAVREQALASVLSELLPVLDDIGRAREHGELTGGFKSVAESLEASTAKLGLTTYGEAGDPFDPTLHDALMHSYSTEVTEPACVQILQPGYKVGDRIVRPARVAVAEPGDDTPGAGTTDE